jgi:hypothetical protein
VRHRLDWLPGLLFILAVLGLMAWGMRHPGWESRPAVQGAIERLKPVPKDSKITVEFGGKPLTLKEE